MFNKAPFRLPSNFLADFGYPGRRRFVGLYWEPCGDESCYDDGVSSACGMMDNGLFLGFIYRCDVADWLQQNRIQLGNSDREAGHWLVVDAQKGEVYVASWRDARRALVTQSLPDA